MSNNEYREAQQQARTAGLAKRHEQRLENATYTAAEVKVLTEAALRLGRKEAAEEIATAIEKRRDAAAKSRGGWEQYARSSYGYMTDAAEVARSIGSLPSRDAPEPRTDPSMGMDLPPEPQAVRSPQEDA